MTAAVTIEHLSVAYRHDPVVVDANVVVPAGASMGVVGPNGAGKSTLIKAALGLVRPLTGAARFFGERLDAVRSRVAYVPQAAGLDWDFPVTVAGAAVMGTYGRLGWWRRPGRVERAQTTAALEQVGMAALARRQVGELSGGQRQRVLLARALVQRPDLYVLDEPFSGVDARTQQALVDVLADVRSRGAAVLLVHHDLGGVRDLCDHVTLINRRVVASGPVDAVFTAEHVRTTYDAAGDPAFADLLA